MPFNIELFKLIYYELSLRIISCWTCLLLWIVIIIIWRLLFIGLSILGSWGIIVICGSWRIRWLAVTICFFLIIRINWLVFIYVGIGTFRWGIFINSINIFFSIIFRITRKIITTIIIAIVIIILFFRRNRMLFLRGCIFNYLGLLITSTPYHCGIDTCICGCKWRIVLVTRRVIVTSQSLFFRWWIALIVIDIIIV